MALPKLCTEYVSLLAEKAAVEPKDFSSMSTITSGSEVVACQ
jgi:hypothetical protein